MRFGFTKADRLLKRPEFLYLLTCGKEVSNKNFVAKFYPGRFENTRLGITVSRRVGNAVARNRIKRLVRDIRVVEQAVGDGIKQVYDSELPSLKRLRGVT